MSLKVLLINETTHLLTSVISISIEQMAFLFGSDDGNTVSLLYLIAQEWNEMKRMVILLMFQQWWHTLALYIINQVPPQNRIQ